MCGGGFNHLKYTAEIQSYNIWKILSMKIPMRELQENTQEEKCTKTRLKLRSVTSNEGRSREAPVGTKAYKGVQKDCDKEKYSSNDVLEKDTYGNICSLPEIFLCPGN